MTPFPLIWDANDVRVKNALTSIERQYRFKTAKTLFLLRV